MTLREVWDVTEEPIYLYSEKDIAYIGSKILLQYEKRNIKKMYSSDLGITLVLEDEEDD